MKDKGNRHGAVGNCLRNDIFVNPPPLPLLCEISGALHLAQPDLTAGRLADEIQVNFEIFKVGCRSKYPTQVSFRLTKVQHHYSLTNAFQLVFSGKATPSHTLVSGHSKSLKRMRAGGRVIRTLGLQP